MSRQNFFRTAFNKMVAARERQARRYVHGALLAMDDNTLRSLGYSRSDLRKTNPDASIF